MVSRGDVESIAIGTVLPGVTAAPDAQQYELVAHDIDESIEGSRPSAADSAHVCPPSVLTRTSLLSEPLAGNVDARQSEPSLHDTEVTGPIDAGIAADDHDEPPSEL
jgi:hypothetical protein